MKLRLAFILALAPFSNAMISEEPSLRRGVLEETPLMDPDESLISSFTQALREARAARKQRKAMIDSSSEEENYHRKLGKPNNKGPKLELDHTECGEGEGTTGDPQKELCAGQHHYAGEVTINRICQDDDLIIEVDHGEFTGRITEYHINVGDESDIVGKPPGHYPVSDEGVDLDGFCFVIEDVGFEGDCVYVAVHGVCQEQVGVSANLDAVSDSLEDVLLVKSRHDPGQTDSYWDVTSIREFDSPNTPMVDHTLYGPAWCVDLGRTMRPGREYTMLVVPIHDVEVPGDCVEPQDPADEILIMGLSGVVDKAYNLQKVNYLLNKWNTDTVVEACDDHIVTYSDLQTAIWQTIDSSDGNVNGHDECSVEVMFDDAEDNGCGYEPPCGGVAGVLLIPVSGESVTAQVIMAQVIMGDVDVWCEPIYGDSETCWAKDDCEEEDDPMVDIPNNIGWGSYFQYCESCPS